jgi:polyferredoxin
VEKIDRTFVRYLRYTVQWSIVFFLIYAGYIFYVFVDHFAGNALPQESPLSSPPVTRPPSVDGFLPIGSFMALKLWVTTGIFDRIHPSGLVIFATALVMALLLKKGFCGWICPVGALSDATWKIGKKLFTTTYRIHPYADYGLRSLKYLLMIFFLYIVLLKMSPYEIMQFLEGDYYKIADVKMLYFFTSMSSVTFITLLALFLFSLVSKNIWCRYICPYGALLGLISMCSPLKITRNEDACIHCGKCTRNCPSLLPVEEKMRVSSPECTGCLTCVSHCPARGALDIAVSRKMILKPFFFALLIIVLFFGSVGVAKLAGKWHSAVPYGEYQRIIPLANMLDHP